MSIFYQEEVSAKRGKCVASALKTAFSKCHFSRSGKLLYNYSTPSQPEHPAMDFDQQEQVLVSAVMSKYMESKSKRNINYIGINRSLCNFLTHDQYSSINGDDEEFVSALSISDFDTDAFVSAFSRSCSSSLSDTDFKDQFFINDMMRKRWIIMEFIHCEGWPFGLCRKALLLPPLPKSPVDSWSWKKNKKKHTAKI